MDIVLVCGSRDYPESLRHLVVGFVRGLPMDTVLITGGCEGPDLWAEEEANNRGMLVGSFPVSKRMWQRVGKAAGPRRNEAMVSIATKVGAFWDGASKGTSGTVAMAKEKGIPVAVYDAAGNKDLTKGRET